MCKGPIWVPIAILVFTSILCIFGHSGIIPHLSPYSAFVTETCSLSAKKWQRCQPRRKQIDLHGVEGVPSPISSCPVFSITTIQTSASTQHSYTTASYISIASNTLQGWRNQCPSHLALKANFACWINQLYHPNQQVTHTSGTML